MLVDACTTLCIDSEIVFDLPYRSDQRRTSSRFTEISISVTGAPAIRK